MNNTSLEQDAMIRQAQTDHVENLVDIISDLDSQLDEWIDMAGSLSFTDAADVKNGVDDIIRELEEWRDLAAEYNCDTSAELRGCLREMAG